MIVALINIFFTLRSRLKGKLPLGLCWAHGGDERKMVESCEGLTALLEVANSIVSAISLAEASH